MSTFAMVKELISQIDARYTHLDQYPARAGALEVMLERALYMMDEETRERFFRSVSRDA